MTGNLKLLSNFVEKFLGMVKFGKDQIAPILGYGDLVQGNITIKSVYYVKGLNQNLFSVGQFYDANLEVAFWKSTCYIPDLKGNDILTGSRGTDLYSMMTSNNIPFIASFIPSVIMEYLVKVSKKAHILELKRRPQRKQDQYDVSRNDQYAVFKPYGNKKNWKISKVGVARPKIEDKDNFELKGQFLKELRTNTFCGSDHEDANEHIEKVLEIVDLFHIPNITIDQVMLRAFPMSLTGAASHSLRNKPSGSITNWEDLKTKFLSKYCPPACTAKKMKEINNFQQEPDENLNQAWERFKELLMKCPQHYLTEMQETTADAKVAIQEMAKYSQNGTMEHLRTKVLKLLMD
ncbi:retrovirus-related pol polyprotein from transposon TNT 1-94 [Tanacetum coccineum]